MFEIEERLKAELDIPVFHDDQHGTAIICGAALLNALEVTGKEIDKIKVVINGAGASAIATGKFFKSLGVDKDNLLMLDSRGVIHHQREEGMNKYKSEFAVPTDARNLHDALEGADVLVGLSIAGSVTQDMIKNMAPNPMLFVLANPTPEIMPELALEVRPDAIIGTGRSDYPNQVNNVLGFPFLFRGALDVYATSINEEMKMAAAKALAALAHEDVPDSVLTAYGRSAIKFSKEYLIPKPLDPRVLLWVAPAVAQAAMESGVARRKIDIDDYRQILISRQGAGQEVRQNIINRARAGTIKRIVFPEGEESKIIRAAAQIKDAGIGEPILMGRRNVAAYLLYRNQHTVNTTEFSRRSDEQEVTADDQQAVPGVVPRHSPNVCWLYAFAILSGFGTLAFQVLYLRMFSLVFHNSTYTFGLVVAVFIVSLAIGAAVAGQLQKRIDPNKLLGVAAGLGAIFATLSAFVFAKITKLDYFSSGGSFIAYMSGAFWLVTVVVSPAIVCFGMILPLTWSLADNRIGLGRSVGNLTAVNTIAASLGAIVTSFLLLLWTGLWGTFVLVAGLFLVAGDCGSFIEEKTAPQCWTMRRIFRHVFHGDQCTY